MVKVFEKLGYNIFDPTIYNCIKSMDMAHLNDSGIEFRDFLDMAKDYFNQRTSDEGMWRIWRLFDKSETGVITKGDMQRISNELDFFLTRDDIDTIFLKAAGDGKQITY